MDSRDDVQRQIKHLRDMLKSQEARLNRLNRQQTYPSALAYFKSQVGDLVGTTNQVNVNNGRDAIAKKGTVRLSLPQDIDTNATPQFSFVLTDGEKYTTGNFVKGDATLANITGLSVDLEASKKYIFTAVLHVTADVPGGHKYAISGTCTASSVIYQINSIDNATNAFVITSRQIALGGASGEDTAATVFTVIQGFIDVNTAGTLTVQFAQVVANNNSTVLPGSTFIVREAA